ncbi:MAG: adenylyl-sulfate kinase [Bryobacterales bacterium]
MVWFTGLPSSGKTALAQAVRQRLTVQGAPCCLLDSDAVRAELHPPLGYSGEDRASFYQTLGGLAALLAEQGLVVLTAATAPLRAHRDAARRDGVGFLEVFVDTPVEECERRDSKGLYAKARKGEIKDFPGVSAPYEKPKAPDVTAPGGSTEGAVAQVCYAVGQARG